MIHTYKSGFFYLFVSNALINIFGFLSQLFAAWILSESEIGYIKLFQIYLSSLVLFCSLGLNTSILKLCSQTNFTLSRKNQFLSYSLFYSLIFSTIVFLLIILLLSFVSLFTEYYSYLFYFYLTILIPQSLVVIILSYFHARKLFKDIAFLFLSIQLISFIIQIISTFYFGFKGYILSLIVSNYILLFVLITKCSLRINKHYNIFYNKFQKLLFKYSKYGLLSNFLGKVSVHLDFIILSLFLKDSKLFGIYAFAVCIEQILQIFTTTVQQIFAPFFSSKQFSLQFFKTSFLKYNSMYIFVCFIFGIASYLLISPTIFLIFKNKYEHSVDIFNFFIISWFIRQFANMRILCLFGLSKLNINLKISFINFLLTFLLSLFLVNIFGLNGAILTKIISSILFVFITYLYFNNETKHIF